MKAQRACAGRRRDGGIPAFRTLAGKCVLLFCLCLCLAGTARAGQQVYYIDLPAQSVAKSLNRLSEQTGVSVLFPYDLVQGKKAKRVEGRYTLLQALDKLLKGTGLSGGLSDKGVLTISLAKSQAPQIDQQSRGEEAMPNKAGVFSKLSAILLSTFAAIQSAPAQEGHARALEEVIVTAQKRQESLQDVGIAVTALNEKRLVDAQVNNIQDLQNMAPGLTLGESFGFAQIMIRGVGTDNPFAGGDPSVAMHVDGVVIGQSSAQLGTLFDVKRIEVLRGPQGTLYGRNSTGGSINVITNKPTENFTGYGRFTGGNYDLFQFEGAVSGPLSKQLRARLATKIVERGGYGKNHADGGDIDDASQQSVRGHLEWLPTPDLDVLLSAEYHHEDDKNYMPKFRAGSYPNPPIPALLPQPIGATRASDPHDIYADTPLQNKRKRWSISGTVNWHINDAFSLTSISNYQAFDKVPQQDFDMTAVPFYTQSEQIHTSQASQELQLHYEGGRINGLVGLYYYYEEIKSDNRLYQAIPVPPCGPVTDDVLHYPVTDLCFHFRGAVNTDAAAVFANFNVQLINSVTLNLGGRYSYERRKGFTDRWIVPGMLTAITFADKGSFNDFTPRVGLQWTPLQDLMLYATYSEGFKSGILLSGQTTPLLDPETVKAYEIGFKGRFFNRKLQLNTAGFYYDYTNLQLGRSVPAGATGFTLVYENAASAESKGVEVEADWLATDRLRFSGSLTYLDAVFTNYETTDPFKTVYAQLGLTGPAPLEQLRGNRLVQAPEWEWTLRGEYDFPLPIRGWNGTAILRAAYKSKVYFTQFNYDALGQDGVTTIDANVIFTSEDGKWSLNLWGKNLTDETIYTGTFIINGRS